MKTIFDKVENSNLLFGQANTLKIAITEDQKIKSHFMICKKKKTLDSQLPNVLFNRMNSDLIFFCSNEIVEMRKILLMNTLKVRL